MHLFGHPRRRPKGTSGALHAAARVWAETLERRLLLSASTAPATPYLPPDHEIAATSGLLLSAPATGQPLDVALAYLRSHATALGLSLADLSNTQVTDQYTDSDTGETHIYLEQRVNGLDVAGSDLSISLTRDNQVIAAGGHFVANAAASLLERTNSSHLSLTVSQALEDAKSSLGLKADGLPSIESSSADSAALISGQQISTTLLDANASLDPIPAKLVYIPTASGLRLGWDMVLRTPDGQHWYDVRVDGNSGALLGTVDWADGTPSADSPAASGSADSPLPDDSADPAAVSNSPETYDVYPLPEQSPDDGPRMILTNPASPIYSPFGWLDTNGKAGAESTLTTGNNVNAYIDAYNTNVPGFQPSGGPSLAFDAPLDLTQDPTTYRAASVEQLFYLTNTLHDIHAAYGFTEAAGNFQQLNYSGQGVGNDPLQAQAQDGGALDNSNMFTPPDGQSPVMQIYLWDLTPTRRDAVFDSTIVIHEYGHGVSTRLTGGSADSGSLSALQSGGMGEGWSDWWALMLTQKPTDTQNGGYGIADYVTGQSIGGGADGGGVRAFPYSYNLATDPLTFSLFNSGNSEVHSTGTIWTSALWDLNWLLIDKYGFSPNIAGGYNASIPGENGGNNLALKLVMDALKIQPSNPSFVDGRNAILAADQALNGGKDLLQIWTAFARRGLGFSAVDTDASASSITAAFDLPPQFQDPRVVAQSPAGTQTTPPQSLDLTFSTAMDVTSFNIASDVASFTGPGGVDLSSQITGFSWSSDDTTLHISFAPVSAAGRYSLVIGPQILSAAGSPMDQNANGRAGEPTDQYTASFGYTNQQLTVASTTPAAGSIAAMPFPTLDVQFNQPIDPTSVNPFVLIPSRGEVVGATVLNSTTVEYTFANLNAEGPLDMTFPAGAVKDAAGNDSAAFTESFDIDIVTTPFPVPLFAQVPAAPLVWDRTANASIGYAGDSDSFTINLDAGQVLSAVVSAGGGLRPTVDLLDNTGQVIASGSATTAGGEAIAETAAAPLAGTYTICVSGLAATTGDYSVRAVLNAAVQSSQNHSLSTAQNLDGSFISLGNGAAHGAVFGQLPSDGAPIASDNFSSGSLGPAWTTFSSDSANGEIVVAGGDQNNVLLMDHNDPDGSIGNLNEAVWAVDLSNRNSATLTFQQTSFGDEQDFLPLNFTGHVDGDGVSISNDNFHWHRVWDGVTTSVQGVYGTVAVDLAAAAAEAGMKLGPGFRIKFQQFDNYPIPIDGRGFANISITTGSATADYYSLTLKAGQTLGAQIAGQDIAGGERLDLLDPSGNVLASGIGGISDTSDLTLNGVPAASDGTYYLRVAGNSGGHYLLSITTDADLEVQRNDMLAQPIVAAPVNGVRTVLGHLDNATQSERFSIFLNSGQVLSLATATPGDGSGEPVNLPDPLLTLLDPKNSVAATNNNSAPDGRNALITYTATSTGNYTIIVGLAAIATNRGDYVLSVSGGSTPAATFSATVANPPAGGVTGAVPQVIDVSLSSPVLFSSVSPAALKVDGIAAGGVTLIDGQTLGFTFNSILPDGSHAIAIAAGAFTDLQGDPIGAMTSAFTVQSVAPRLLSSSIQEGDVLTPGALAFTAAFNQAMRTQGMDASAIQLVGQLSGRTFFAAAFGFDVTGKIFTATYAGLPEDNYTLTLRSGPGGFADVAGNALDGEASWPLPTIGSGDGTAGGNFSVDFSMDVATTPFPTPLNQQSPAGSQIYTGFQSGALNTAGDSDSYTIALSAGELASVTVFSNSSDLTPRVTFSGPDGTILGAISAAAPGQNAILNSLPAAVSGTYTITVSGAGGIGIYTVELALNAAFKVQNQSGIANNSLATAQSMDSAMTLLDPLRDATRGAVLGSIDSQNGASDYYIITLKAGQWVSMSSTTDFFGGADVRLLDASGTLLAIGGGHGFGAPASITDFVVPHDGTYYIGIDAPTGANYTLVVFKNADLESGTNISTATAQDISSLGIVAGFVGGSANAQDDYSLSAVPGNILTIRTDVPGGPPGEFDNTLNPQLTLLGPSGKPVTADVNSVLSGRTAQIRYTVPAGGGGVYTIIVQPASGSGEYVLAVDSAVPAAPLGAPALAAATDSGISSDDRVTNFNNATPAAAVQFVVPSTTAGATVQLFANGILIGTAIASGSTLSMSTDGHTLLPDGLYEIVARQTLSGGTVVVSSPALPVRILAVPPLPPAAPTLAATIPAGGSLTITNNATPFIGVSTPLQWRMFRDGALISASASTAPNLKSTTLAPGVYHFTLEQIDVAGNVSAMSAPLTLTIDQTPPLVGSVVTPPITAPHGKSYGFIVSYSDDSGINLSSLGNTNIQVLGPAGYVQAATLSSFSVTSGVVTALYRVPAPSAGWTGVYSGTYVINVLPNSVFDVAGNASSAGAVGQFSVSLPITPPRQPQLDALSDRGISDSDDLTNLNNATSGLSLTFDISDTQPGGTVSVYADGVLIGSTVSAGVTAKVVTNGAFTLTNGPHAITARITAPGHPQTADSPPLIITIDNQALATPAAPVLRPQDDSGVSDSDGITDVSTPTFLVDAQPYFQLDANGTVIEQPFILGTSITVPELADGSYDMRVIAEDAAGNQSAPSPATHVVIETQPPVVAQAGTVDSTFGDGGLATLPSLANEQIMLLGMQPGGKIIAAGPAIDSDGTVIKVVRFNTDGSQDTSFTANAATYLQLEKSLLNLKAMAIGTDGSITLLGATKTGYNLVQLFADGSINSAFSEGVTLGSSSALNTLTPLPDGTNVFGGAASGQMEIVLYPPTNQNFSNLFHSYSVPGFSSSVVNSVALDAAGNLIVAGTATNGTTSDFVVARISSLGVLDTSFGTGGFAITPFNAPATAIKVAVQSDGKIVVAGNVVGGQSSIGLARYNANGSLDPAFGTAGTDIVPLTSSVNATDMILQPDGRIVVAGNNIVPNSASSGFAVRLTSNGLLDPLFAAGGPLFFVSMLESQTVNQLLALQSGQLLAGGAATLSGVASTEFALSRIITSGPAIAIDPASDSGISNTDGITNVANPVFDVDGFGSDYYRVYLDGTLISGLYENAPTYPIPLGQGTVTFTLVDPAGNESLPVGITPYTYDPNPPTAETAAGSRSITSITNSPYQLQVFYVDDTGLDLSTVGNGDLLLTGPNGFSETSTLLSIQINGANRATATYNFAPPGGVWSAADDGIYTVTLQAGGIADIAGNLNLIQSVFAFDVEIVSPTLLPPALATGFDSGVNNSDGITNFNNSTPDKAPQFIVGGNVPGTLVTVYANGVPIGSATASDYFVTVTADGHTTLPEGANNITVRQTAPGGTQSADSTPLVLTIDSTPPAITVLTMNGDVTIASTAPFGIALSFSDSHGFNSSNIGVGSIVLTGPDGRTYSPASATATTVNGKAGINFQFSPPGGAFDGSNNGLFTYTMVAGQIIDNEGNAIAAVPIATFHANVTLTGAPSLALSPDAHSGLVSTDNTTNFNNASAAKALKFVATGTIAGSTLSILWNGHVIGSTTAPSYTTVITCDGITTIPDGANSFTIQATSADGSLSYTSPPLKLTILTVPPPQPTLVVSFTDTGLSNSDGITSSKNFSVFGGASLWDLYINGVAYSPSVLSSSPVVFGSLPDGKYVITTDSADEAGNRSPLSNPKTIVIDTQAPTVTVAAPDFTGPSTAAYVFTATFSDTVGLDLSTINANALQIVGASNAFTTLTLVSSAANSNNTVINATFSVPAPTGGWNASANGTYSIKPKTLRDLAGNSAASFITIAHFNVNLTALQITSPGAQLVQPAAQQPQPASVVGRYIFYNNSAFDGKSPAANSAADKAIATDKRALLPGRTAGFANYTSFTNGINGIAIDVSHLPRNVTLTAADFGLRVGNSSTLSTWKAAPAPKSIAVRRGAGVGGSDRIELIFADRAIVNRWLQVTVLPTARTGLAAADVFYFGNLIGESGDSKTAAKVTAADENAVSHLLLTKATLTTAVDYNRDGVVNNADLQAACSNQNASLVLVAAPITSFPQRMFLPSHPKPSLPP